MIDYNRLKILGLDKKRSVIRDPHRILMIKDSATLESGRSSQMEAVKDRLKFWQASAKRK